MESRITVSRSMPLFSMDEEELTASLTTSAYSGSSSSYASDITAETSLDDLDDVKGRLRVAIITENFLPKTDGVTRTLSMLISYLKSQGHHILVIGPSGGTESNDYEYVGTIGIPLSFFNIYGEGLSLNFYTPSILSKIQKFKPDVIHFVDPIWLGVQTIPWVKCAFPNVPLVGSYHTNIATYLQLFGMPRMNGLCWMLQRWVYKTLSLTFVPSPSTANVLETRGIPSKNLRIWSRGVYTQLFSPQHRNPARRDGWLDRSGLNLSSSEGTVLLYVGRLSWEKNLRLLIESFHVLCSRSSNNSEVTLVLVGDGPAREDMESLCKDLKLQDKVKFEGFKKGEELAEIFASSDIFVFPSWTETFGQVVLEAQASGLPVVGLEAEGVRDLITHDRGLLLPLPSTNFMVCTEDERKKNFDLSKLFNHESETFKQLVEAYAQLCQQLIESPERRKEMGRQAREFAMKMTWNKCMNVVVDGYREVKGSAEGKERKAIFSFKSFSLFSSSSSSSPFPPLSNSTLNETASMKTKSKFGKGCEQVIVEMIWDLIWVPVFLGLVFYAVFRSSDLNTTEISYD